MALAVIRGVIVLLNAFRQKLLTLFGIEEASHSGHVYVVFLLQSGLQFIAGPTGEIFQILGHRVVDHLSAAEGQQRVGAHETHAHGTGGLGGQTRFDEGGRAVAHAGLIGIDGGGPLGNGLGREACKQDTSASQGEENLAHGCAEDDSPGMASRRVRNGPSEG